MERVKKYSGITQNLNRLLLKALDNFTTITQWTDIYNWLINVQSILKDNPSPYITQKILFAKRLNQCINKNLNDKIHQVVLRIHSILFHNMRVSVDGNINDYIKLFADDLGIYSITILPYFTQSSKTQYRILCLQLIKSYYLDLGKQLIPMLPGLVKSILPVYGQTNDNHLINEIQNTLQGVILSAGRKYLIGSIWSAVLKFSDCRSSGLKYLGFIIPKMDYIVGQQDFSQSHGFSAQQNQLLQIQAEPIQKRGSKASSQPKNKNNPKRKLSIQVKTSPVKQLMQQPKIISVPMLDKNTSLNVQGRVSLDGIPQMPGQQGSQYFQSVVVNHKQQQNQQQHQQQHHDEVASGRSRNMLSDNSPQIFKSFQKLENPYNSIALNKYPLVESSGLKKIKRDIDANIPQVNFPNSNTLVISALASCLDDQLPLIKRSALDFLFSHLRLKSTILKDEQRQVLIQAAVRLFRKKQLSISKRVNRWLFGKQDSQNVYNITEKNEYVIPLLIEAFKKILDTQPKNQQDCVIPIKILQNFYIQHPQMVKFTLSQICINILRYIFNYGQNFEFSSEVTKAGQRFLQNLPSHYNNILSSMGRLFVQGVQKDDDHLCFEISKYIDYCYVNLMKHQHGVQQLDYLTQILQFLSQGLKLFSQKKQFYSCYMKDSVLLTFNLLSRRQSVIRFLQKQQEKVNKKYLQETGVMQLPQQRIEYQKQLSIQIQKQQQRYIGILEKVQEFFIKLGTIIKFNPNIQQYQQTFKVSALLIVKIQFHLPKKPINSLPKWFQTIQTGIRVTNPGISLSAIQAMIKCLLSENKHPVYNSFKNLILAQKNKKVGNDYQKLALEKLWSLLDFPHMHSKIIDLIIAFSKYFPYEFTDTVKKSFATHNVPQKQASIQRFSHFWRLTGFKYKDLLISNKQFAQLNKVGLFKMLDFLDDQNPLVRHAAKNWLMESMVLFYRILQPLFTQLLKVCKDWYQTPKGIHLIKQAYDTNIIFDTFRRIRSILSNGSYAFLRYIYQTPISQNMEQLRPNVTEINTPLITQGQKELPQQNSDPSQQRQPVLPKILQKNLKREQSIISKNIMYMDLLVILSVKYIQGVALQSMGTQFYVGNSGVNTSAIQLLQSLLNYIDNPSLSQRIVNYILQPLFKVLNQGVINKEYIVQIQLLNLFKNIITNSAFRKKGALNDVRNFFKRLFTNVYFVPSILKGLNTPFSYVRSQFISFLTNCIPLIADFLQPSQCTECIKKILVAYYKIIKQIKVNLLKDVFDDEQNKLDQLNNLTLSRIRELQQKTRKQQKILRLTNNLQQVAKTNQILSVLYGVSEILNYFYDLNKLDIKSLQFQFTNPYTIFDTFKSILTLGLASSQKDGKLVSRTNFLHNLDTCQSVLKDLSPVYQTILRAWPLSQQYVRIATQQFSAIGMKNFNFERFNKYNNVLKDLIDYVEDQKQSIWGKIFSIMQPMFYRFPTQITDIYLKLWVRQCPDPNQKGQIIINVQKTQFLMKIIQTIIVNNFPINIIIHAFLQTQTVKNLKATYQSNKKQSKKGVILDYQTSATQAKVLYFIYVYYHYVYLDQKALNKDILLEIWSTIMKVIKPFLISKTPSTSLWILQIINLCSKKYNPKELLVIQKFKHDLHAVIKQKLKFVASVAAKKQTFYYQNPIRSDFDAKNTASKYKIVLPFPPCLYQIYRKKTKETNQTDKLMFTPVKPGDQNQMDRRTRLMAFKSLKSIGLQLIQNTYAPEKNHWVVTRTCEWMEVILPTIQDKLQQNMLFAESASQVLYDLLDKARVLFIKALRLPILNIFNKDDFFICNKQTLNYWAKIIDWVVGIDKNNQTFSQYLQKVTLSSSFFTSVSTENKKRIKSFQRICFLLYSGGQDQYALKIRGLLQKIASVIRKTEEAHPALLICILFSIRILILKLSQISLNQLFLDIWPMLLALLMQLFTKNLVKVELANEISKNPNLLLAGLKLIQMISLTNLSSFAHHQWIFIFDYFGITISVNESQQLQNLLSKRPQLTEQIYITKGIEQSPFIYTPYLSNCFPHFCVDYIPNTKQKSSKFKPQQRKIIITDSFVSDDNQLRVRAYALCQYFTKVNQYRMKVAQQDIEDVIVNDFINLDSFIHKIDQKK